MIDDDSPFGQQLLGISVGQPKAEGPPHRDRDRDHIRREPEPGEP